ncbi:MAG: fibronectin type III domain-containing protein [Clostridia bacterium]
MYRVRAKRSSVVSDWSAMVVAATLLDEFGVPTNFKAYAGDTFVSLTWDTVVDAVYYDVEIDGAIVNLDTRTSTIHDGLEPNTAHNYRVRAVGTGKTSDWSNMLTVTTFALPAPKNITSTASETSIQTVWDAVYGAASYDLDFDGTIISDILDTTYTYSGLAPGTQHTLSIRAKNDTGTSNWSIPVNVSTIRNGLDVPFISGAVEKDLVIVLWNSMNDATGYDLEVDGTIIGNLSGTSYRHTGLAPGTSHTYRVRVRNVSGTGNWSNTFTTLTMSETPAVPTNVTASSDMTSILVTWDKVTGAEGYELEIDGVVVDNGTGTSYLHSSLTPDTTHTYRVRAKNLGGWSGWSGWISKNTVSSVQTFSIDSVTGDEFNLMLTAANIQDLGNYSFTVRYNIADFDVTDLSGLTPRIDTSTGSITGTDIKITQYEPGTIVFTKAGSAQTYEVWSGIVNSIKFKAKHDGQSTITYSIN